MLHTEPALSTTQQRERTAELMFERYDFCSMNISVQGVCALYAQDGLRTGVVLDSGEGVTHITPVFDGFVQSSLIQKMPLGGRDVTRHLQKLLTTSPKVNTLRRERFSSLNAHLLGSERVMNGLKEKCCYVAYDVAREHRLHRETTLLEKVVPLYDNRARIRVGSERFLAPEIMFQPSLFKTMDFDFGGCDGGVGKFVYDTIMAADLDLRRGYFGSIMVTGGNTMFPGFRSRLERELQMLYKRNVLEKNRGFQSTRMAINIDDSARRDTIVFKGASVFAEKIFGERPSSTTKRPTHYVTKEEYAEYGAQAIHRLVRGHSGTM